MREEKVDGVDCAARVGGDGREVGDGEGGEEGGDDFCFAGLVSCGEVWGEWGSGRTYRARW